MKEKITKLAAVAAAITMAITLGGCATSRKKIENEGNNEIIGQDPDEIIGGNEQPPEIQFPEEPTVPDEEEKPVEQPKPEPPKVKTVSYLTATTNGVNIRSGAGTSYSVRGAAEKSTLYALDGESDGWYKTRYKNGSAYISSKYCVVVEMTESGNEKIEAVIAEGTKLLGTPYVYGAVRMHDGKGNTYKYFTTAEFDCSSLMQYIFYKGAGKLLDVNTRTQIFQGETVSRSQLKRGDLMFFTNESRKNNTGVERVGHVALYLGDNWILHTASDYAKIEQISSTRWSYFIQGQRVI